MLTVGATLRNIPILSLQTGHQVAKTESEVIDPAHLTIVAYYVKGETLDFSPALLRVADIREISKLGMIVNSSDDLVRPEDLITMKNVLDLHFELEGMPVIDTHGEKLGKVIRYTFDLNSFVIQQIHVRRPLLKSFADAELIVHRHQIVAITSKQITVHAPDIKQTDTSASRFVTNAFRASQQKAEARDIS